MNAPLMNIQGLVKTYPIKGGAFQKVLGTVRAVDGVDLEIRQGEAVGLVGESGCGKSTLGRAILRLEEPDAGSVEFNGVDILQLSTKDLKQYRRDAQVVFQDPYSSLNPRMKVLDIVGRGLEIYNMVS